ncbi:MAG: class I SAM-dependent methyltransferase [Acidimicrobiales bacterium]
MPGSSLSYSMMTLAQPSLYAEPRMVSNLQDCIFYHTMDLPGVGLVEGSWDLRAGVEEYLGGVDFRGKRALDVGTANGFLCFEMERRGAEVVAYDLNESCDGWDIVPFGGRPAVGMTVERAAGMGRINNGFWLAHAALGSGARMAYGSVYSLPSELGPVDITVFGAILLHLRDPFHALQRALALTTECVVVTEPAGRSAQALGRLPHGLRCRLASSPRFPANLGFLPDPALGRPDETWWNITPWALARMLGVLGFSLARLHFHSPSYQGRPWPMYTLVARRVGLKP